MRPDMPKSRRRLWMSLAAVSLLAAACHTAPTKQSDKEILYNNGLRTPIGSAFAGRTRLVLGKEHGNFYALDENGRRVNTRGARRVMFKVTCESA